MYDTGTLHWKCRALGTIGHALQVPLLNAGANGCD